MNFTKKLPFVIFLFAALLSSCGGAATATESSVDAALTAGVGTMVAAFFETQTAMVTPITNTPIPSLTPLPTITPFVATPLASPTFPAQPTATFFFYTSTPATTLTAIGTGTFVTPTVNPGSLASGCNNLAFIRDETIPSGTVLAPQQNFDKIWKVQNTGTCDWVYQYSLVLTGGDEFGAGSTLLRKVVSPGDWTNLTINMDAPNKEGVYTSYWRLADADGNLFGATLAVSIEVKK